MKATVARALAAIAVAVLAAVLLSAATEKIQQPDKLIILSTVDVKGKTSPCG